MTPTARTYLYAAQCDVPEVQAITIRLIRNTLLNHNGSHSRSAAFLKIPVRDLPEVMKAAYNPIVSQQTARYCWVVQALRTNTEIKHLARHWVEQLLVLHPHDPIAQCAEIGSAQGRTSIRRLYPSPRWDEWSTTLYETCPCAACEHIRSAVRLLPQCTKKVLDIARQASTIDG